MALSSRSGRTAGSGGCWASDSRRRRSSSQPRSPAPDARASPAASACTGSPACCCPSCPAGCRGPWGTRCPAALGAPSLQVCALCVAAEYLVFSPLEEIILAQWCLTFQLLSEAIFFSFSLVHYFFKGNQSLNLCISH